MNTFLEALPPCTPELQCCGALGGFSACEVSAVETPPRAQRARSTPATLKFGGAGIARQTCSCRRLFCFELTCEISSATSPANHLVLCRIGTSTSQQSTRLHGLESAGFPTFLGFLWLFPGPESALLVAPKGPNNFPNQDPEIGRAGGMVGEGVWVR